MTFSNRRSPLSIAPRPEELETAADVRWLIDSVRADPTHPFNDSRKPGADTAPDEMLRLYEREQELLRREEELRRWNDFVAKEHAKQAYYNAQETARYRRRADAESYELTDAARAMGIGIPHRLRPNQMLKPQGWYRDGFVFTDEGELRHRPPRAATEESGLNQAQEAANSDRLLEPDVPSITIDPDLRRPGTSRKLNRRRSR